MSNPTTAAMNLTLSNPPSSGAADDQVYVSILGTDPSSGLFGYLDLTSATPAMSTTQPFTYQPGVTSQTLAQLAATFGGGAIPVPAVQSARIYVSVGSDFTASQFPASGPSPSKGTQVPFDKVEFDTSVPGSYNINGTSVDFYGISYTLTAAPGGSSTPVTVGYTEPRETIAAALWNLPLSPDGDHDGNTRIFRDCFVCDPSGEGTLRVLAPKTMALTDWGPVTNVNRATQSSHFFDAYVNQHVFRPNRQFTFYNKFWQSGSGNNAQNQLWGSVSADGQTMSLFTDAARTQPYAAVPRLSPPSTAWPAPSFSTPTNYHNVTGTSAAQIDWGFLLGGNVAAPSGVAEPWGTDPAAMAIMVSIVRGVAHLDDGTVSWVDPSLYYQGNGSGTSTAEMPIFYYAKVLHQQGVNGLAYVLSFDDVYGQNPSIFFADGGDVTLTFWGLGDAKVGK